MEFKDGDVVICVEDSVCGHTKKYKLDIGKRYICALSITMTDHILIKPHPEEIYTIGPNVFSDILYLKSRFIHEKDWIKRMKYGV